MLINQTKYFKIFESPDGTLDYWFYCPGCKSNHMIKIGGSEGWTYNGKHDNPTFEPSIQTRFLNHVKCTVFIKQGYLHYTDDCQHDSKGVVRPMEDIL